MNDMKPTLLSVVGSDSNGNRTGLFQCCYCGTEWITRIRNVDKGLTKSCGCLQKEKVRQTGLKNKTHGLSESPEFHIWAAIKQRCHNEKCKAYKHYGGRGIKMCDEWFNSFERFYEDMGPRPNENLTVDRKDNNGNYCKENCQWVNMKVQQNNRRNNRVIEFNGKSQTLQEWSDELQIGKSTLRVRLDKYKWSIEKTLTTPVDQERLITFNGKTQTLAEWSRELKIKVTTLIGRLDVQKLSVEEAFTTPVNNGKMITYQGKTQNLASWSKELDINLDTLSYRLKVGKPLEEVFRR